MSSPPVVRTIREQIADRIRRDVLSGRLEEGTSLREQALAQQYGVSRAPVRDALLQLTQEGLLEAKPNCGVRVGKSCNDIIQPMVVRLRLEIETFALRQAFPHLTHDDLDYLDDMVDGLRKACLQEDIGEVVRYEMALHRYLLEASGIKDVVALWLPVVSRMMLHYSRHHNMMESHHEHAAIVAAIRKQDLDGALAALVANIQ